MNEQYIEVVKRVRYLVTMRDGNYLIQVFDGSSLVYEGYSDINTIADSEQQAEQWIKENYCIYYPSEPEVIEAEILESPREMTEDEVREKVYDHIRVLIQYWAHKDRNCTTLEDAIEGFAFSIMSTIDGCAGDMPRFIFAPDPHPDDRDFFSTRGEDWYPENHQNEDIKCDLAGSLHELWHSYNKENK